MSTDDDARKAYAEAGVDLPELSEPKPEDSSEAPTAEETPKVETEAKAETPEAPKQPEAEPRKRTIYDDYKEKKAELKSEKELREQVERERDELKQKLDALNSAGTPTEKKDAQDDLEAFALKINADPSVIREMRELFTKGQSPDPSFLKDLEDFKQWRAQNSKALEQHAFEQEFKSALPSIKDLLPGASDEEMDAIKAEVDRLSHTKEFHDKPLDFVVFRNKSALSALISPKKPGPERKGRAESMGVAFEFDPNADLSKLSPDEFAKWEAAYKKATSAEGLLIDAQGRKTL